MIWETQRDRPTRLKHQQSRVVQKVAEFFQILGAERAVDDAISQLMMRTSVADDDLVTIVDTGLS